MMSWAVVAADVETDAKSLAGVGSSTALPSWNCSRVLQREGLELAEFSRAHSISPLLGDIGRSRESGATIRARLANGVSHHIKTSIGVTKALVSASLRPKRPALFDFHNIHRDPSV
jgi:hypothetical protein